MNPTAKRALGTRGLEVTQVGLGGAALGNLFRAVDDESARATIEFALSSGLNYFDTAPYYGHGLSEHRMGEALRAHPRDSFVLSSKVGRLLKPLLGRSIGDTGYVAALPFEPVFDYSYDGVMRSYEDSLARLGTDRIDILLIHDIGKMTHGARNDALFEIAMKGGYRALEKLRSAGAISSIGLGVNEIEVCLAAMERGDFDCFLLAGRYTLLEQAALDSLLPKCVERHASIILGGPYNSGLLTGEPKLGATWNYAPAPNELIARAHRLYEVCRSHGVPLETAALQFPLFHPCVSSVIPGSRSNDELSANLRFFATPTPAALWRDLKSEQLIRSDAPTGA